MRVYFAQHGIAVDESIDPARPLSDEGTSQTNEMARHLADAGIDVRQVLHSGKLRAQQTAAIFAETFGVAHSTIEGMGPKDDPVSFVTFLRANQSFDSAMFVGHLPHLQRAIAMLLGADEDAGVIRFQNSAVACIDIDEQNTLAWFMVPTPARMSEH